MKQQLRHWCQNATQISLALVAASAITACTRTAPVSEPVSKSKAKKQSGAAVATDQINAPVAQSAAPSAPPSEAVAPAPAKQEPAPQAEAPKPAPPVMEDCDATIKFTDGEPVFLPENKVIMTRVMSPCLTKDGQPGHKKSAGWMAMGFPCTGGEGRIDWKGTNYNRPKMVSFLLETSCAMGPADKTKIRQEAQKLTGISQDSALIAFNPFVIQYWEVPGFDDADTSFTVDLRSGKGLDDAWVRFIKPKPLRIFLVGRENAWVPGNYMYAVEGDLIWASKNRFTFSVDQARILTKDERAKVQSRCEALRPERDCGKVF